MIIVEITDQELIDRIIDEFFETIDHIMVNENHIHKYPGQKCVTAMLNNVTAELGLSIRFFHDEHGVLMQSDAIGREVMALSSILKKFRRVYRHNKIKAKC